MKLTHFDSPAVRHQLEESLDKLAGEYHRMHNSELERKMELLRKCLAITSVAEVHRLRVTTRQHYKGHPIYGSAIPVIDGTGWYAQGLVFSSTEAESPIVEIKRLGGPRELTFPTKEEAEQHALELCIVWIDQHPSQTPVK